MTKFEKWEKWIKDNKQNLSHPAGYEEHFVRNVLMKIAEIEPEDVYSRYLFVDQKKTRRYVDFCIISSHKRYKLAIELDGYTKFITEKGKEFNKEYFEEFLARQNDLVREIGLLLRYTNKQMFNNQKQIIQDISATLKEQAQGVIYKEELQKIKAAYDLGLQNQDHKQKIDELSRQIEILKDQLDKAEKLIEKERQSSQEELQKIQQQHNQEIEKIKNSANKNKSFFARFFK